MKSSSVHNVVTAFSVFFLLKSCAGCIWYAKLDELIHVFKPQSFCLVMFILESYQNIYLNPSQLFQLT